MSFWISETFVNATKEAQFGEAPPYDSRTDNIKQLFKNLQTEYGGCVSSMYRDNPDGGKPKRIGWVFRKRMRYEDARTNGPDDYYIREVWVMVHNAPPERTIKYHEADLDSKEIKGNG